MHHHRHCHRCGYRRHGASRAAVGALADLASGREPNAVALAVLVFLGCLAVLAAGLAFCVLLLALAQH